MPCKRSAHPSLRLHVETQQTISQHSVSIHARLTASFETSSLRSEAESLRLGSPEQDWGEGRVSPVQGVGAMQFKRAEWAPEKTASVTSVPMQSPDHCARGRFCETLHQAQGPQGEGQAPRPARVSLKTMHTR